MPGTAKPVLPPAARRALAEAEARRKKTPQPEPPPLLPEAGGDDISGANAIRMELVMVGLVLLTGGFIMRVKFQRRKTS